jgi:hypothetical protein
MNIKNIIDNNSIYIHNNYFKPIMFEVLSRKMKKFSYYPTCQPESWKWLGNRFQGYPCYDCVELSQNNIGTKKGKRLKNYLKKKLEKDFNIKIKKFWVTFRFTKTEEINKSAAVLNGVNQIHRDAIESNNQISGVFYFTQSYISGTALYITDTCKMPDIKVSSRPNRLILYNPNIPHAAHHDDTFLQRDVMIFNFTYENNKSKK